ncbi:MAG: ClbS/DfsB family four-helix bundle protein [Candidatus Thorarchaeota archaeon]
MKRKLTKEKIIERVHTERRRLEKNLASLSDDDMLESGVIGEWSVKDIMAHLFDWEQRFLGWYEAGLRGEVPETPAPGLKWSQLRILNQQVFEKHRDRKLEEVKTEFQSSFAHVLDTIDEIPEDDIFEIGRYRWTGRGNIGGFILANTANHYRWAKSRIRSWMKRTGRL